MVSTLTLRTTPYKGPTGRSGLLNNVLSLSASAFILTTLPFQVLMYILFRPRGFSLKLYLISRFMRYVSLLTPILPPPQKRPEVWDIPKPLGLKASGVDVKVNAVTVEPAPESWRGAYAAGPDVVKAIQMPGYLITPPGASSGTPRPGEKLIVYIHGGGYIRGHPLWTALPHRLARDTGRRVYCVQYRKTLDDTTAFPAPLLDALAGWHYVTQVMGFDPKSCVLSGDSAGAHLSLALCRQLNAIGQALPGALGLLSPWVDFTCSFPSWDNHSLDYLTKFKLSKAIASATRHYAQSEVRGEFFSPALAPAGHWTFLKNTPVFMTVGGQEAFTDEDLQLAERMRADGVEVTVFNDTYGLHDTPVIDTILGKKGGAYDEYRKGMEELLRQISGTDEATAKESGATIVENGEELKN